MVVRRTKGTDRVERKGRSEVKQINVGCMDVDGALRPMETLSVVIAKVESAESLQIRN